MREREAILTIVLTFYRHGRPISSRLGFEVSSARLSTFYPRYVG